MVRLTVLRRPAANPAQTEVIGRAQRLFREVWKDFQNHTLQWENRGSGETYARPQIPEKLKEMTLNEKLIILRRGAPPDIDIKDMCRFLIASCTNDEMSTLYGWFSTARRYASDQAKKAWDQIKSAQWRQGSNEKTIKALAMQICRPHEWEAHFIAEVHELTKTQSNTTKRKYVYYGQLVKKHGKEEAASLIENGKVEKMRTVMLTSAM